MKRITVRFDHNSVITIQPDTTFDVSSEGTPEVAVNGPVTKSIKVKDLVAALMRQYDACVFDPSRRPEFNEAAVGLEAVADALRGVSSTHPKVPQPNNCEQVAPAAQSLLKAQEELGSLSPVTYKLVEWPVVERHLADLTDITEECDRLTVRLQNMVIRQAYHRQVLYSEMDRARALIAPVTEVHRGLERTLAPYMDLFYGPAQEGVETKKVLTRALTNAKGDKAEDKADDKAATPKKPTDPTDK